MAKRKFPADKKNGESSNEESSSSGQISPPALLTRGARCLLHLKRSYSGSQATPALDPERARVSKRLKSQKLIPETTLDPERPILSKRLKSQKLTPETTSDPERERAPKRLASKKVLDYAPCICMHRASCLLARFGSLEIKLARTLLIVSPLIKLTRSISCRWRQTLPRTGLHEERPGDDGSLCWPR